jgi:hypothetical protein
MLFKLEHKEMIIHGTKTATRRVWKKPMVKVEGVYKAKLQMLSKDYFAKIKVIKLYKQKLCNMKNIDAIKEGYPNLKEFRNIWIKINGDFNPYSEVYVIEFEVLK